MFGHLIVEWNRKRGLLNNFDPALELKMLSEEAREFYQAETFEHQLCEYADFLFVLEGTKAKYNSQVITSTTFFSMAWENYQQMMEWAISVIKDMRSTLRDRHKEISVAKDVNSLYGCIDISIATVIANNNLKGKNKVDGKIVKSDAQNKPEDIVRGLIYGY